MKLGKDENMLFLGSKDMNVYLIDIAKGKLCVVYEGHWSKTIIFIISRPCDPNIHNPKQGHTYYYIRK